MDSTTLEPRQCEQCGRRFLPKRIDQRFHTRACQRDSVKKRYHLAKYQTGEDKRIRYSVRKLRELLGKEKLDRSDYLDALAAYAEAEQQIAHWQQLKQQRAQVLKQLARPGLRGRCIVLRDGEPPPQPTDEDEKFGVSSTDGLMAVVAFGSTSPQPRSTGRP